MYYLRTLKKVKCKSCGLTTYDATVEKYEFIEESPKSFRCEVHMFCPNCYEKDSFKYLQDDNNTEMELCEKPNCNRVKLDNSPLCSYHWDIANG